MAHMTDTQAVIQDAIRTQSGALIRSELRTAEQRAMLEDAVRDAIMKHGCSIDAISEASGLTPDEIRRVLARPVPMDGSLDGLVRMR